MTSVERQRLGDYEAWTSWGPYLSERAWGTVREDYSADGDAWTSFPYEHSKSRTYRWNEDGLGGFSDSRQNWCLAFAFWNGRDDHLKERLFGLNGHQGNHGEDVKEEWWHLDATPTHSWGRMAYAYPQQAFPYAELIDANARRGRLDPEYELLDTRVFDDGWWDIQIDHAKAGPEDLCIRLRVTNRGPSADTIHLLPTLWLRNRWRWGRSNDELPEVRAADHGGLHLTYERTGSLELVASPGGLPLVCDNESNRELLWSLDNDTAWPKDAINDHVVNGVDSVNPDGRGTKAALWYQLTLEPGESGEVRVRLARDVTSTNADFDEVMSIREFEADEFYDELLPHDLTMDERLVTRQALAGLLFSKQWYHFDVDQWLDGDPAFDAPPASRLDGRNTDWRHLKNADVIPMPDSWEYPWYAAWDTAFQCLPLTLLDPTFSKDQLLLLGRVWYQHPNGQLPAYEWSFGDVNPPVHAWSALRVFELDGGWDSDFLERILHKLVMNFTWWVNRRDANDNNLFEGGFLGLDNIGPFNRSDGFGDGRLEQADATAWMAMYSLDLLDMSLRLAADRPAYEDLATKFVEHFAHISTALNENDIWNEEHGFYYDMLRLPEGDQQVQVRSMVGLIPIFATRIVSRSHLDRFQSFSDRLDWFRRYKPQFTEHMHENDEGDLLLSIVSPDRLCRLLEVMLDENEFLSPHGVRGLSKFHSEQPFSMTLGSDTFTVGYEPGESETSLFGGNSNWRGPVWFPLNYLLIESLRRFDFWAGGSIEVEFPTGSGQRVSLGVVADRLGERLTSLFLLGADQRRPAMPDHPLYRADGEWADRLLFHEYFHGDNGRGLGASHQTGWTALVASLTTNSAIPFGRRRWYRDE